jgi:hypothetical protein
MAAGTIAPAPDSEGYIDLTSVSVADWARMGGRVYGNDFIKLGIDCIDEMLMWLRRPAEYDLSRQKSCQSPAFSKYNVAIQVSPHDRLFEIKFSYGGHELEIQATDNEGRKSWEDRCSLSLDHVPTRAEGRAAEKESENTLWFFCASSMARAVGSLFRHAGNSAG